MATNYRSYLNPNSVCVTLRFDKDDQWEFRDICKPIEDDDECAAIEEMADEVELTKDTMKKYGYTLYQDVEVELCRSRFDKFIDDAKIFGQALLYLGSMAMNNAANEISDSADSFWDSVVEFFSDAFTEASRLREYNRKIAPWAGIGYGVHF